jgi:hypothetical protein
MTKPTYLALRLQELDVTPAELAAIVNRPVDVVNNWIEHGPDASVSILLRILDIGNEHAAALAVERVRNTHTRSLKGPAVGATNVDWPGDERQDGTAPS